MAFLIFNINGHILFPRVKSFYEFVKECIKKTHPFVSCDNINQYLNEPLLKKLTVHPLYSINYYNYLDNKEADYLPDLCNVVGCTMSFFREKINQEAETVDIVNNQFIE